jgi:hypothetical protein
VTVTSIEGIVTVALGASGLSRMAVSPAQPANCSSGAGALAATFTNVPAG